MKPSILLALAIAFAPVAAQSPTIAPSEVFRMTAAKIAVMSDGTSRFTGGTVWTFDGVTLQADAGEYRSATGQLTVGGKVVLDVSVLPSTKQLRVARDAKGMRLTGGVSFNVGSQGTVIRADEVDCVFATNTCELRGNVRVEFKQPNRRQ